MAGWEESLKPETSETSSQLGLESRGLPLPTTHYPLPTGYLYVARVRYQRHASHLSESERVVTVKFGIYEN